MPPCSYITDTAWGERRCGRDGHHQVAGLLLCWQHERLLRIHYEAPLSDQIENLRREVERIRPDEYVAVADNAGELSFVYRERAEADSVVYFAEIPHVTPLHPRHGQIKIGRTINLEARMATLGTVALKTVTGGSKREAELHQQFARLRADGEWFRAEAELADYVAAV